jgi:pectate lyase
MSLPTDVTAASRVQLTGVANGSGVVVRASGSSYYLARILTSGTVEIDRVSGSTITRLASASTAISDGTWYTVGLTVTGTGPVQLSATLNGKTVVSATDSSSPLSSGSAGLYGGTAARTQYSDFTITSP